MRAGQKEKVSKSNSKWTKRVIIRCDENNNSNNVTMSETPGDGRTQNDNKVKMTSNKSYFRKNHGNIIRYI